MSELPPKAEVDPPSCDVAKAAELLPDDDLLGRINTVNLEHVLGEVQTNRGDLHVDGSLM
jgi:hypothetical protein